MRRRSDSVLEAIAILAIAVQALGCDDEKAASVPDRDLGARADAGVAPADDSGAETGEFGDAASDSAQDGSGEGSGDGVGASGCVDGALRPCFSGRDDQLLVGTCAAGVQTCVDGEWGACQRERAPTEEVCDGLDNDCDSEVDEGVSNACGLCGADRVEVCDDGLDNDCNGTIDDVGAGCACGGRLDQPCYSGRPQTLGVGICTGGTFDCIEGAWGACEGEVTPQPEVCDGLDNDCDGAIDEGVRNACGGCAPTVPAEVCDGIDNDCDGLVDEGVRGVCGACLDGLGPELCGDGFDNDCDGQVDEGCPCTGPTTCYPGPAAALGIGQCAAGTRTCDSTGERWGPCTGYVLPNVEVCDGLDNDCDGRVDTRPSGCSICGAELEICDGDDNDCDNIVDEALINPCGECLSDVVPEESRGPEFCNGADDDCDGLIDEGLLNECGTCTDEGCSECEFFVEGWSATERCGDGQDNDGDGQADEDCPCTFGATQACFLGAPNSRRIGACLDGTQTCIDRANPRWGPCEGGILPSPEICDGKDNDCNGCVDDGESCDVVLACPVEDTVTPLRNYPLLGSAIWPGEADSWRWTVTPPPGSGSTGPVDPNARDTSFYVDLSGDYRITLTVTIDGEAFECTWILHAVGTGLRVELTWDRYGSVDLDLHLHRPGSTAPWCSLTDDCFYLNCDDGESPPWGYPDSTEGCPDGAPSCRNPRLDIDNIRGFVPENINIDNPRDGDTFRVMVHEYSKNLGVGTTYPEVRIYCGGLLSATLGVAPDRAPLVRAGTSCQGDTWRVADVTMRIDPETGAASCEVAALSGSGSGGWDIRRNSTAY